MVVPVVDLINPSSFEFSKAMLSKSGFDWSLTFKWEYIPWDYFDEEENHVRPFELVTAFFVLEDTGQTLEENTIPDPHQCLADYWPFGLLGSESLENMTRVWRSGVVNRSSCP